MIRRGVIHHSRLAAGPLAEDATHAAAKELFATIGLLVDEVAKEAHEDVDALAAAVALL